MNKRPDFITILGLLVIIAMLVLNFFLVLNMSRLTEEVPKLITQQVSASEQRMLMTIEKVAASLGGIEGPAGEDGANGLRGPKGDKGDPGDPGKDGMTPVKGVDYVDGKDGKTPQLEFDGEYWWIRYSNDEGWKPVEGQ